MYYPEFKEARGQLIALDLVEYDPPAECPREIIRNTEEDVEALSGAASRSRYTEYGREPRMCILCSHISA